MSLFVKVLLGVVLWILVVGLFGAIVGVRRKIDKINSEFLKLEYDILRTRTKIRACLDQVQKNSSTIHKICMNLQYINRKMSNVKHFYNELMAAHDSMAKYSELISNEINSLSNKVDIFTEKRKRRRTNTNVVKEAPTAFTTWL